MRLQVRDAARWLERDEETVYEWVRSGELPATRINDQYRINSSDLLEWARARGHRLSPEAYAAGGEDVPDLAEALEAGGLHRYSGPNTREAVLQAVVDALPVDPSERPLLYDLVLAREFVGSTGIGEGIAIPHVRAPLVIHGVTASLSLWYLEKPVDFGSPDGGAVDTIFFLAAGAPRTHLLLLSRLAGALHHPAFRQALKARAELPAVLATLPAHPAAAGGK